MNAFKKSTATIINCAFSQTLDDTFYMGPHFHPRYEIMYCAENEFDVEIYENPDAKKPQKTLTYTANTYIVLQPNTIHRLVIRKKKTASILNIEFTLNAGLTEQFPAQNVFTVNYNDLFACIPNSRYFFKNKDGYLSVADNGAQKKALQKILNDSLEISDENIKILQQQIFFYQLLVNFSIAYQEQSAHFGANYINAAVEYIKHHFASKITVNDIAKKIGINKYYLQKLFKSHLDVSILTYINDYRIKKAMQLLKDTALPINTIQKNIGFENRQTFLYEFKKKTGTSPFEYRRSLPSATLLIPVSTTDSIATVEIFSKMKYRR